jgi:hypothetical protein
MNSRDNSQLGGRYKYVSELSSCDPVIKVNNLWDNQKISVNGKRLSDDAPAIPCGLIAKSFFNDTFRLFENDQEITIK